jgi:hypothetical protein
MSFFYELIKDIKFDSDNGGVVCCIEFGKSALISGAFKVVSMTEKEIVFCAKKELYLVKGDGLKIKTMAVGEMMVSGNVLGVVKKC